MNILYAKSVQTAFTYTIVSDLYTLKMTECSPLFLACCQKYYIYLKKGKNQKDLPTSMA